MKHATESQLNDYADDVLPAAERTWIATHLAQCAQCTRELEALTRTLHRVAALPRSITPHRDLRADIWTRIQADDDPANSVLPLRAARRDRLCHGFRLPAQIAAAAVLVIATASITLLITRREPNRIAVGPEMRAVRLAGRDPATLERQYADQVRELEFVLHKTRAALSPETQKILDDNLRIIDQAIRESQTALAGDPGSAMLVDLLRSAYQRKLELLRQAAKSSSAT